MAFPILVEQTLGDVCGDHESCFSDSSKVSHEYWLPQVLSILLERRKSCTKTQDTKVVGPNPDAGKIFISREISM